MGEKGKAGMNNRLRLLQGATALLYFGPLLAGLGGFGWSVIPVFVVIFLLWLFILRPQDWPRRPSGWLRPEAQTAFLTQGLVQVLLVAVSFGIGRGIGGVLGAAPRFPLMLPLAISFLSIPLARMIWDPWQAEAVNDLLDGAVAQIGPARVLAVSPARLAAAGRMVATLDRLPQDSPPDELRRHLAAMTAQVGPEVLRVALMDKVGDGSAGALHRRAAVVHATDGAVADALAGSAHAATLFQHLSDPEALRLFARRCAVMIGENPARRADCPAPAEARAAAQAVPEVAEALHGLAMVLEAAPQPAGRG
ncbi:hypothetical protein [Tabrizicola oligotrophica]|uniref:Uncharacterized protein n=1 Tax=Tabrizicola oligotrophica TaxID=2710650 RepID=A0A6M0QSZ8_9RHOB|nr:hypothetical protein [Tabrizicola oligotrophica]NEY90566.1 hypothetical protein [Tabrizicola oligotrophica]